MTNIFTTKQQVSHPVSKLNGVTSFLLEFSLVLEEKNTDTAGTNVAGPTGCNFVKILPKASGKLGDDYSKTMLLDFHDTIDRYLHGPPLNKGLKLSFDPRFKR